MSSAQVVGQAELRRAFDVFDANNDGMISKPELHEILRKLQMHLPEEDIASILESVDVNGDGLVDFNEFHSLYSEHLCKAPPKQEEEATAELLEAFKVFDKDNDGFITSLELHSVLCSLGLPQGQDMKQIKNMIKSVDSDGDGKVNFKEFKNMMSKALNL